MRKYSLILLSLVVGCLLFTSCADEELANKGAGKATEISLSFETPDVDQIVTKGINAYTLIDGLYLFIFDSNGQIEGEGPLYYPIKSSDTNGAIASKIPTTTGNHYIFAVANASNSSFATIDGLESITTKDQLLSKTASLKGDLLLSGNLVPMAGTVDGADANGMINITPSATYKIQLERLVASVKFEVSCKKEGATFNLKSYEVVNYPQTAVLWNDNQPQDKNVWRGGTINNADKNQVFEFYMFENKPQPKQGASINSYDDREKKVDPMALEDIEFLNASPYATYVILRGSYTGPSKELKNSTNVSAEVSYYVHLGNTNNNNYANFDTERNIEYTYNISIMGVDELITEVETNDPYDRGDGKISLDASTYNLDSHYEVFNITVSKGSEYQTEGDASWLSFRIFDKKDTKHITKALTPNREAIWVDVMKYKDSNDNKYNAALITDMRTLNATLSTYFKENPDVDKVDITCYADENVYSDTYRECLVFRDVRKGNGSTIVRNGFNIRQNYLRKFYNNNGNYYGLEVLNETGRLTDYAGTRPSYDMSNGWANMRNDVGTNWPTSDEMKKFYAACMSRNRDEDGNGKIEESELKWYLPAINQYIGMWIGADALKEARLYTLNKHSNEWRYVSNSYDTSRWDHWILWGDQGSSTGMKKDGKVNSFQLRCIRNIGSPTGNDYYTYDINNRVFTMKLIGDGVYRNKQVSGELGSEGGHMGTDNKVYKKFKVAKERSGFPNEWDPTGTLSIADQKKKADRNASICSEYYEETILKEGYFQSYGYYYKKVPRGTGDYNITSDNSFTYVGPKNGEYIRVSAGEAHSDGGKWRLPNQREQSLMFAERLLYGYQLSRTFSTFYPNQYFGYDQNLRVYNSDPGNLGVRCVRDE